MPTTSPPFTERDVSEFFDRTTSTYLSFWDSEGVLHTGYFADDADTDYPAAADRTSDLLATEAGIDAGSTVLDVGCGCGNFLLRLAARTGCRGEGLDLSVERIRFAQAKLAQRPTPGVSFRHGSATALPYASGSFSHVVSQDALFLVPEKPRSHTEMHRVLAPGGILAVTDFLQPTAEIGPAARRHVYDRVRWSSGYSLDAYAEALTEAGFEVLAARSLDAHIRQTYRVLGETARERAAGTDDPAAREWIGDFAASCAEIQAAIDRGEFGWGMFVARKPAAG
ncbi:methyltransferase domain-containing protein [Micromonospora sp. NPDC002296]|uniref:class I SAM-dependent methyltransferase n=1 Tax=Micromonospora sp. NPDC002296 TaxID=3154271 RepID=UPI0033244BC6